jgi:hypothetical protein
MTPTHAANRKGRRMPPCPRLLAILAGVLLVATGCSETPSPGVPDSAGDTASTRAASPESSAEAESTAKAETLAEGTCWTGDRLGADPQDVRKLAGELDVPYAAAARALADRPAFVQRVDCGHDHAVEVHRVVRLPDLQAQLTDYATLLRLQAPVYDQVARSVAAGCMTEPLRKAAARSGLPDAVMSPVLPKGAALGWAPASPAQWAAGQRVFACTLTWTQPESTRYTTVLGKDLPASQRTCIDTASLLYVDGARPHDRERIAIIEARRAVAAGTFPGPKAIKDGPSGRYLEVPDAAWASLDAACTAYLRAISTVKKLTGVANVDVDQWPTADGSFPVYCDADTRPDKDPVVRTGSVYNR